MLYKILFIFTVLSVISCSEQKDMSVAKYKTSIVKLTNFAVPKGEVILKISGNISQKNQADELWLDTAQLQKLPQLVVTTSTLWTKGESEFKGPLMRDVLSAIGNQASLISAVAINEYKIEIPVSDMHTYNVILAMEKDGQLLSLRDKGPLWLVYPWSSNKLLQEDKYYSRSIWQLVGLNLHD
ncbi:MAG: molybdopterin-dependent oxidoreductase [Oceanospirillaceae bacterium]